jgi:hypothetical protein
MTTRFPGQISTLNPMTTQGGGKVLRPAGKHTECIDRSNEDVKH